MIIRLYQNQNYYDRRIIRLNNISEYNSTFGQPIMRTGVTFIVNDGVSTSQIVNYDPLTDHAYGSISPSYCIVTDDTDRMILHRWWVVQSEIIRYGQARLSLLRDVIADFYEMVLNSPTFIKKGWINSTGDPAIFNNEDMTFNQIKTGEVPITDMSGAAWYVGYLSKDYAPKAYTVQGNHSPNISQTYDSINEYPYHAYDADSPLLYRYNSFITSLVYYRLDYTSKISWDEIGNLVENDEGFDEGVTVGLHLLGLPYLAQREIGTYAPSYGDWGDAARPITGVKTQAESSGLLGEDGKIYKIGNRFKRIKLVQTTVQKTISVPNNNVYSQKVLALAEKTGQFNTTNDILGNYTEIEFTASGVYPTYEDVVDLNLTFSLSNIRATLQSEPFDLIAIPATAIYSSGDNSISGASSVELSKSIVSTIIAQTPSGEGGKLLYDFQIVPYCPLPDNVFTSYNTINLSLLPNTDQKENYTKIQTDNGEYSFIFYCEQNEFQKISRRGTIDVPSDPKEFKIQNETTFQRLCSPNYNGQFEFSATKNGGVRGWNIDFTYKPYNPYIRISPIFNYLYGRDFGDARGLICGGDFSISQTNDAWEQYQLQNKNFQVMFDRQITNMEVNNAIQRKKEVVSAAVGTLQGVASGAMAGGLAIPGGIGAVAGGLVGGVASAAGGIADIRLNDKLRAEALDYAKDQFGYQMQNIQALPYSLTKVGSQNVNYKFFPFVEYYTCHDVEKTALSNKIEWNGMTVMRIGAIRDFMKYKDSSSIDPRSVGTFIQGKPVRLFDGSYHLWEDSHLADVISAELQTGVYII